MASANWYYRQTLKPAFAFNNMSPAEFFEHTQTPTKPLEFSRFNPYNLGGKNIPIKKMGIRNLYIYIGRAHDLAGIYSLVALQVELKSITEQDWADAIKQSSYKNPYTAKPFDFDTTTKSLSFSCFSESDICQAQL